MLTLQEFKKALGERGETLTEPQIEELRTLQYQVAETLFDNWLKASALKKSVHIAHKENGNCIAYCFYSSSFPYVFA